MSIRSTGCHEFAATLPFPLSYPHPLDHCLRALGPHSFSGPRLGCRDRAGRRLVGGLRDQEVGFSGGRSDGAQIVRRGLTRLSVSNNVEGDLLSHVEPMHPSAFDCDDMHEDILAAVIWLDEAEALLDIEPLHGSLRHLALLSVTCVVRPRASAAGSFEFWRKVVSPTRGCAARPSRSAEARFMRYGALWLRSQGSRLGISGGAVGAFGGFLPGVPLDCLTM